MTINKVQVTLNRTAADETTKDVAPTLTDKFRFSEKEKLIYAYE